MGFSMKRATPGKRVIIWSSISRPGCVVPRNMGGLPTTNARGRSLRDMFLQKSSSVRNTRVFSYAERTNVSHFFCRTAVARSTAGSMSATTLRRGPSLLWGGRRQCARAAEVMAGHVLFKTEGVVPGPLVRP